MYVTADYVPYFKECVLKTRYLNFTLKIIILVANGMVACVSFEAVA